MYTAFVLPGVLPKIYYQLDTNYHALPTILRSTDGSLTPSKEQYEIPNVNFFKILIFYMSEEKVGRNILNESKPVCRKKKKKEIIS